MPDAEHAATVRRNGEESRGGGGADRARSLGGVRLFIFRVCGVICALLGPLLVRFGYRLDLIRLALPCLESCCEPGPQRASFRPVPFRRHLQKLF